jgi:PAS domain S-box-containing protein
VTLSDGKTHLSLESQEVFGEVLEHLPVGITILKEDGVFYFNKQAAQIFGSSRNQYAKDMGLELVDSSPVLTLADLLTVLRENRPVPEPAEFRIRRHDGQVRYLENRFSRIMDKSKSACLLVVTTDVTDRKSADEALHRSEVRYRLVSELTSDYSYSFGVEVDGNFTPEWFTEAFYRITGFTTPEEIDAFAGLISLIHQDDQALVETYGEDRIKGRTNVYEFRIVAKNGELKWIRDYSQPVWSDREDRVVRILGAAQDITKRKEVEEALKDSETRNKAILEAIPDWIFRIQRNGTILDFRGGQDSRMNGKEHLLIKKNINEVFPQKSAEQVRQQMARLFDQHEPRPFEFQWVFADGVRYFEASLVRNGKNEILLFAHDVSERARLEKMKSDFINRASHELRTPLTGAILMSELIDMGVSSEELQEYWGHLKEELNRQRSLVERLLTVGRIETGSFKLKPEPLDLKPILTEAQNTVFPQALTRSIQITTDVPDLLPLVIGDHNALEQVFTNLLGNAVKFSGEGSSVSLWTEIKDRGVSVWVKDQGVGIPAADIPHLFEGFFRAQNVIEKGIPGSGVGLYIVKSIIEELGGKVSVESELNQGTLFEVWLPLYNSL